MKATVTSAVGRTVSNTESAFKKTMVRAGVETNPTVMLYNTLRPEDFDGLSRVYGQDVVLDYIKDMESKKLFK